jgi:hypothetical protein
MEKLDCFLGIVVVLKEARRKRRGTPIYGLGTALILTKLFSFRCRESLVEIVEMKTVIEPMPLGFVHEMHFANCACDIATLFEKMSHRLCGHG